MRRQAEIAELELPEFGLPTVEPPIPAETYRRRLRRLRERAREAGYTSFVVYADREHSANLAYLTGYDPRFEEAVLVLDLEDAGRRPVLMVGNEGWGYSAISPIRDDLEVMLNQSFSLLGQDRSRSRPLADLFRASGIGPRSRVGTAGWKHFGSDESVVPEGWVELPSYLVDVLRSLAGAGGWVHNANALLMDSSSGLRVVNEVEQLAWFEFAATFASQGLRNVMFGLRPGMTEFEAVELMRVNGLPWSCHLMMSAGPRATMGLPSPSLRRMARGEPFTMAYGVWGALNARAGFLVADAGELPDGIRDYVDRLVAPYFEAVVSWYEHLAIGVAGGALYDAVHERIGDPFFGVGLNPGHLIHLDEWVHSPVYRGSNERLVSGMALQVDVIPATGSAYFTTNIEDGVALADEETRAVFASRYPEAWSRIQARRRFMAEALGIRLRPEVLPFSNIPAYLPPYLLAPRRAMRMAAGGR